MKLPFKNLYTTTGKLQSYSQELHNNRWYRSKGIANIGKNTRVQVQPYELHSQTGILIIDANDIVHNKIAYPYPNFNGCSVEVWEWIIYFIPRFIMDVITYPYWD